MVFKLIRVDSEEPRKIGLVLGTHLVGRGKFLHNDDNDKRVSRHHAELEVTDELLSLKSVCKFVMNWIFNKHGISFAPLRCNLLTISQSKLPIIKKELHQNPCFYIKKNSQETVILHQNDTTILNTGDKFGLLPDNFWYEVLQCSESESPENVVPINKDNEINSEKDKCKEGVTDDAVTDDAESPVDFNMSVENVDMNRTGSPSLLSTDPADQESTQAYTVKTERADNSSPNTPSKRGHDSLDSNTVDSKKVKTEPASPGPQAGPSNDQVASNGNGVDQKPNIVGPNSPVKPAVPQARRERCMYGANCYRRNPEHKARFSHPSDSDWGPGARGVCPYGSACRRTDPRHWQHHEHPPGVNPPPPAGRRQGRQTRKIKRRASESDDGDSSPSDLIVTGKRSRKPINRDITGLSDSEDEDPYKTDESDEWQPPSDFTNSEDFSQKS